MAIVSIGESGSQNSGRGRVAGTGAYGAGNQGVRGPVGLVETPCAEAGGDPTGEKKTRAKRIVRPKGKAFMGRW
jgi:hypothetical protein